MWLIEGVMAKIPKVILLMDIAGEYGRGIVRGVSKYAHSHGPWALYCEPGGHERSLAQLNDWDVNGIITRILEVKRVKEIMAIDMPTVAMSEEDFIPTLSNIETNGSEIGAMAAGYLIDRGFHEFAYCGFSDLLWSLKRSKGVSERIEKAGFRTYYHERPYSKVLNSWDEEQSLMADWLLTLPKPVGVVACDDEYARRVVEACKIAGLNVPEQVAVLGVDNDETVCELSNPQLSSVALSTEKAGYEAAAILDKLMSGEKIARQKIFVTPTYVVTRQSTDTMAISDNEVAGAMRFIREHAHEMIQVDDVAEAVALSRRNLERRFRKVLSRSVLSEIRYYRANCIARMLMETDLSIQHIAIGCGYSAPQNMITFFSKMMGETPAAYRKIYRHE